MITPEQANYKDSGYEKTTEVGIYPANPWGLHDMHGNVYEWVEDRWHENYVGAPKDGRTWTRGGKVQRVLRGGSWYSYPASLRAAYRSRAFSGLISAVPLWFQGCEIADN